MKRSVRQDLNLERENDVGVFMFRKRVAGNVCARRNSDSSDMRRVLFTDPVLSSKHSSADIITANHRSEAPIKKEKIMWQLPSLSSNCHLEQPSDLFFIKLRGIWSVILKELRGVWHEHCRWCQTHYRVSPTQPKSSCHQNKGAGLIPVTSTIILFIRDGVCLQSPCLWLVESSVLLKKGWFYFSILDHID